MDRYLNSTGRWRITEAFAGEIDSATDEAGLPGFLSLPGRAAWITVVQAASLVWSAGCQPAEEDNVQIRRASCPGDRPGRDAWIAPMGRPGLLDVRGEG